MIPHVQLPNVGCPPPRRKQILRQLRNIKLFPCSKQIVRRLRNVKLARNLPPPTLPPPHAPAPVPAAHPPSTVPRGTSSRSAAPATKTLFTHQHSSDGVRQRVRVCAGEGGAHVVTHVRAGLLQDETRSIHTEGARHKYRSEQSIHAAKGGKTELLGLLLLTRGSASDF